MDEYLEFQKIDDNTFQVKKVITRKKESILRVNISELKQDRKSLVEARRVTKESWQEKDDGFAQQINALDEILQQAKDNGIGEIQEPDPKTVERKD